MKYILNFFDILILMILGYWIGKTNPSPLLSVLVTAMTALIWILIVTLLGYKPVDSIQKNE